MGRRWSPEQDRARCVARPVHKPGGTTTTTAESSSSAFKVQREPEPWPTGFGYSRDRLTCIVPGCQWFGLWSCGSDLVWSGVLWCAACPASCWFRERVDGSRSA